MLLLLVLLIFAYVIIRVCRDSKKSVKAVPENSMYNPDTVLVVDTETTSLEVDRGEVIQLSALKIDRNTGRVLEAFNSYLKPTDKARIDATAMKVNGISLASLQKAPERANVFREFNEFCKGVNVVMGYNILFDLKMLADDISKEGLPFALAGDDVRVIDVLDEAREHAAAGLIQVNNCKLSTVATHLDIKPEDCLHNSLYDCLVTYQVYARLLDLREPICDDIDNVKKFMSETSISESLDISDITCDKFNGVAVCISGTFDAFSRGALENFIVRSGGILKSGMSSRVQVFISGYNLEPTNKEKRYQELKDKGHDIMLLNESSLIKYINE